ncbi:MAG: hypothetical protein L6R35_007583 [Caloplaca aegaea]|nr:MAG: hypothetical protein L6R35_007583 [Caloplaca aegaea]
MPRAMSAAKLEKGLSEALEFKNWTAQVSVKCQLLVEDFMDLLRSGQLQKNKNQKLVDTFINWVQQDPFWGLELPMAPE